MRRILLAACAVGVFAAATATSVAADPSDRTGGSGYDAVLAQYAAQAVHWSECHPGQGTPEFQCATLHTPEDWSNPRLGDLDLSISRIKAGQPRNRRGVLLLNFGGPGIGGVSGPAYMVPAEPDVAAVYDMIGFDPRGVDSSSALECADPAILDHGYSLDGRDTSPANTAEFLKVSRQFGQACSHNARTQYITTDQTVRDMDLIRAVLGERKISYLGYSAGTWLGAWYATVFPERTDRFALDGNVDWTSTWADWAGRQAKAFQERYEQDFIPWLARYDSQYHLGATPTRVKASLEAIRASVQAHPLVVSPGSKINGSVFDFGVGSGMYSSSSFPDITYSILTLQHWATANQDDRDYASQVWFYAGSIGHADDPFYTIICQDTRTPPDAVVIANWLRDRTRYSLTGASFIDPCLYWTTPPIGSPVTGRNLPPMLMVANDHDPATPYEGAVQAHRDDPTSTLITVRHEGGHTAYGGGLSCVDDAVNAWLIRGTMPRHDISCEGFGLPDPTAAASASSRGSALVATSSPVGGTPYLLARAAARR